MVMKTASTLVEKIFLDLLEQLLDEPADKLQGIVEHGQLFLLNMSVHIALHPDELTTPSLGRAGMIDGQHVLNNAGLLWNSVSLNDCRRRRKE